MNITKYGIIRGGLCEKRLKTRYLRSVGSWAAWNAIKDDKQFVSSNRGWYQIVRIPPPREFATFPTGVFEIGWLRMVQDVFGNLFQSKRKFRLNEMKNWIESIASMEFGIASDTPLSIITPGEHFSTGMIPPKPSDDTIYEKMHGIKRGLVKMEP